MPVYTPKLYLLCFFKFDILIIKKNLYQPDFFLVASKDVEFYHLFSILDLFSGPFFYSFSFSLRSHLRLSDIRAFLGVELIIRRKRRALQFCVSTTNTVEITFLHKA